MNNPTTKTYTVNYITECNCTGKAHYTSLTPEDAITMITFLLNRQNISIKEITSIYNN